MAARKLLASFSALSIKFPSLSSSSSSSSTSLSRIRSLSTSSSHNLGLGSPAPHFSSSSPSSPGFDPRAGAHILDGCDYQHWLVVVDKPDEHMLREDIITDYVRILTTVVGSEEVAREKIYSVSTKHYFAFGALLPGEVANKLRDVAKVLLVLPDSYLDPENQDYGGEPFTEGKAAPYDHKYHAVWEQNYSQRKEEFNRQLRQQQRGSQHVASPVGQFGHGRGTYQQHVGSPQDETREFGRGRGANQQNGGSPLVEVSQFDRGRGLNQQHVGSPQGEVHQLGRGRGGTPNFSSQHSGNRYHQQHTGQIRNPNNRYHQQNPGQIRNPNNRYHQQNPGQIRNPNNRYHQQNPGQIRNPNNRYHQQNQNSSSADQFGQAPNLFQNHKNNRNQDY